MGYSVKWVVENLGITRDMLRYYEKEGLLSVDNTRNPSNKYRDYNQDDIERIWSIKLLIGIGFTAKEIRAFTVDPNFNFYDAISKKVKQLEERSEELSAYLGFAKTIKMTGRIPNVTQVGKAKFEDFIEYARLNWNALNDPQGEKMMAVVDAAVGKKIDEWNEIDLNNLMGLYGSINQEQMVYLQTLAGYLRVIVDLMNLGYKNEIVQKIVKCLYEFIKKTDSKCQDKITPLYFADHIISSFVDSDLAVMNELSYGKEGCAFIAKAIAYFGGYNLNI